MTYALSARKLRSLDRVDAMPAALRECVHEFGLPIVEGFVAAGVEDPRRIRHIVGLCWSGASAAPNNGKRGMAAHIDALLLREGGAPHADALVALLRQSGQAILPISATDRMVQVAQAAARSAGADGPRKQLAILNASLRAGAEEMWPKAWGNG